MIASNLFPYSQFTTEAAFHDNAERTATASVKTYAVSSPQTFIPKKKRVSPRKPITDDERRARTKKKKNAKRQRMKNK